MSYLQITRENLKTNTNTNSHHQHQHGGDRHRHSPSRPMLSRLSLQGSTEHQTGAIQVSSLCKGGLHTFFCGVTVFGSDGTILECPEEQGCKSLKPAAPKPASAPTGIRDDGNARSLDVRFDLDQCERTVTALLRRLQHAMKRSAVLRRCLVTLENSPSFDRDYERFSLVLSL